MTTYIINLARNPERRAHMQKMMAALPWAERVEFVDAVDGRAMTPEQRSERFDTKRSVRLTKREVSPGEIGCTLSHQECYRRLLASNDEYCLILEDDACFIDPDALGKGGIMGDLESVLRDDKPVWISLSGCFAWVRSRRVGRVKLGRSVQMILTSSYLINRAAAKRLLNERPWWTADDFAEFRRQFGLQIWGVLPKIAAQDNAQFETTIEHSDASRALAARILRNLKPRSLFLRTLRMTGHWEL